MITQIVLTLAAALICRIFTTLFISCLMVFNAVCFPLRHVSIKEYGFIRYLLYWWAACSKHPCLLLQLYVPDEDKSIFGRSVNKQVFEGLTTGLLQTVASILGSLWPHVSEAGQGEQTLISSPLAKVKSSATESFNTRTQDLIRYFPFRRSEIPSHCFSSSYTAPLFPHLVTFLPAPSLHHSSSPGFRAGQPLISSTACTM